MKTTALYSDITDWFFSTLETLLGTQKTVTIALPGGHSLDGWYASVIGNVDIWKRIDATRLRWCLVDERCVPADNLDRNDTYVWETFLKPLGFTLDQFLCLGMPEVNALEYSEIIGTPDIAIFGLGPDGHIASLFPGHPALSAQSEGYIHIHDAPKMPPERITLTIPSIQKISHTAFFAVGPEKQKAFEDFLNPMITPIECPAKFLNPDIIFQG
ncbi:MAG: 6-phosphogluconolactonase [Candidatus Gracilibacteria bacterium]